MTNTSPYHDGQDASDATLTIPTMRARRFASAIQGGQYDAAVTMCPTLAGVDDDTWRRNDIRVAAVSPTLKDIFYGERHVWLARQTRFFLFRVTLTDIQLELITED